MLAVIPLVEIRTRARRDSTELDGVDVARGAEYVAGFLEVGVIVCSMDHVHPLLLDSIGSVSYGYGTCVSLSRRTFLFGCLGLCCGIVRFRLYW